MRWHARLAGALLLGLVALPSPPATAQPPGPIVRDGSLGSGPLEVALDASATYWITPEMGERRGANLFHSFWRFGVGANETATFTGPDGVAHVISRVTGDEPSQIDGTLRSTIADADLWLFNPNGVGFGAGAEVDVRGSFHAGAVDYVDLGENGLERYYADRSLPSVLSTAPPAAFGFLEDSRAAALTVDQSRLEVDRRQALELVGSDLSLAGAELLAPGGHVGLEAQRDVALSQSRVDVGRAADTPGTISIRGARIVIHEGSQVLAENESPVPAADERPGPGSIAVEASGTVLVDDSLLSVSTSAAGNAGTIHVTSPSVAFRNGLGMPHRFFGDPYDPTKVPVSTSVGAAAETRGGGAGGAIEIDAESVAVTDGAALSAATVGAVDADGVRAPASGDGGTIDIDAGSVRIANRGLLSVSSWGSRGDAGAIDITADSLTLDARDPATDLHTYTAIDADSLVGSGFYPGEAKNEPPTPGRAGRITIEASSIEIKNGDDGGGHIAARCLRCEGGAGEIWIEADEMSVDGAIFASHHAGSSGPGGAHPDPWEVAHRPKRIHHHRDQRRGNDR